MKGFIWIWLLPIAALIVGGYVVYQQITPQKPVVTEKPTPTLILSPTPTPTAGWETYTITSLGLSFRYPKGYTVTERSPGFLVIASPNEHVAQGGISVETRGNNPYDTMTNAKNYIMNSFTISEEKSLGPWTVYQGTGKEGMIRGISFREAITPYGGRVIKLETIAAPPYITVFDQILLSFASTAMPPTTSASAGYTQNGCARGGCGLAICSEAGTMFPHVCISGENYSCYTTARCEKQADGKCGWTQTTELSTCLGQK